jgi:DNA-binding transcriptional regulator PaaX
MSEPKITTLTTELLHGVDRAGGPLRPGELIKIMSEHGHSRTETGRALWRLVGDGTLRFGSGWRVERTSKKSP